MSGKNGHIEPCAAREILNYERSVNADLRRFRDKTGWAPQETRTPLSELVMAEEGGMLDEWGAFKEAVIKMAHYASQDGIEPWNVMKNLYAIFGHMGIEPWCLLTDRDKGILFGDSHGSHHWLMHRICVDVLRRKGARSVKAPGMKSAEAAATSADAVGKAAKRNGYFNRSKRKRPSAAGRKKKQKK